MKIGILLTGHPPDELQGQFSEYDAMFAALLDGNGFTYETYAVVDGQFPQDGRLRLAAPTDFWMAC